jgi:hypothetical protein
VSHTGQVSRTFCVEKIETFAFEQTRGSGTKQEARCSNGADGRQLTASHMDETLTLRILGWGMGFLVLSLFALNAWSLPH